MKDLAGQRFGRLLALKPVRKRHSTGASAYARKYATVPSTSLRSLHSKSCGCWHRDAARRQIDENRPKVSACLKHGGTSKFSDPALARAYRIYRAMLTRCYDKNSVSYCFYGDAGVTVTDSWLGPNGFLNFLHDVGRPPKNTSLGRRFDVGCYSKAHCAWMTWEQQMAERVQKKYFIENALDQALLIGPYSKQKPRTK